MNERSGPATTTRPEVVVEAPEGSHELRITREFDAPPAAVYAAHVDPALFVQWVGPDDIVSVVEHWDARTGGAWSYESYREADPTERFGFFGSFHELREAERIVQTFTYRGFPDAVSLEELTLAPLEGGRTLLQVRAVFSSVEARDGMVASGMEHGVVEGYRSLDGLLAGDGDA